MVDEHHRTMGIVERLERPAKKLSFLVQTTMDFVFYRFSKMDDINIMCDMYMDEVGIPMLVTMSKE